MKPDEIKKDITSLPEDNPTASETQIRRLNDDIVAMQDSNEKKKLLRELKAVACRGLSTELKEMMERKGLGLEALVLVVNYLTNLPELAKYLHVNSKEVVDEAGLEIIKRRLGPGIEVLGALEAKQIDVTKEWVKTLCKRAPSLQALPRLSLFELERFCKGADKGEMAEVERLVKDAEFPKNQLSAIQPDEILVRQNAEKKAVDEEKLKKAKELLNEAREMANKQSKEVKQALDKKISEILRSLELPTNWYKQENLSSPDQLLQQLDRIIKQNSDFVQLGETISDREVVAQASGGRALFGIYHSEYQLPKTAGLPILLLPTDISLCAPGKPIDTQYKKFSEQGTAASYVKTVESSSTNVGTSVIGFYGLLAGQVEAGGGSNHHRTTVVDSKASSTSVSVLQYIWNAKKTFQIDRANMKLSMSARRMARSIVKDEKSRTSEGEKAVARRFMDRYGSHLPAGVHTLGGVFFTMADAQRETSMETSLFTTAAVERLQAQISVGFLSGAFGIGGGVKTEYINSSGDSSGNQYGNERTSFTYSVKAMGPEATNPETFRKLLSYNSTWAVIDRGELQGYIPVWELIEDVGSEFEEAARILEETWVEDEEKRKTGLENERKRKKELEDEMERKEDQKRKRKKEEKEEEREKALAGLKRKKEEHLKRNPGMLYGFWPTSGKLTYTQDWMTKSDAYDKAIELIMEDPRRNICEMTYWFNIAKPGYSLKCWKEDCTMTFCKVFGEHVLFFSEELFKWKDEVPRRG